MMQLLQKGQYCLTRTSRQAKFWKPKHYDAIPHYVKPHFIDIHDSYKLRSKQQINAEMAGRQFELQVERVIYNPTDIQADLKGRKAILLADLDQFQLTELQLERLKVLVGPRYEEANNRLKLTCEVFDNYEQNFTKIHEMFFELMTETKRAP